MQWKHLDWNQNRLSYCPETNNLICKENIKAAFQTGVDIDARQESVSLNPNPIPKSFPKPYPFP